MKTNSWSVNTLIIYYHQFSTTGSSTLYSDIHAAASCTGKLFKPSFRTNLYGKNSITISAVNASNNIQTSFVDVILKNLTTIQIKILQTKKCIDK